MILSYPKWHHLKIYETDPYDVSLPHLNWGTGQSCCHYGSHDRNKSNVWIIVMLQVALFPNSSRENLYLMSEGFNKKIHLKITRSFFIISSFSMPSTPNHTARPIADIHRKSYHDFWFGYNDWSRLVIVPKTFLPQT